MAKDLFQTLAYLPTHKTKKGICPSKNASDYKKEIEALLPEVKIITTTEQYKEYLNLYANIRIAEWHINDYLKHYTQDFIFNANGNRETPLDLANVSLEASKTLKAKLRSALCNSFQPRQTIPANVGINDTSEPHLNVALFEQQLEEVFNRLVLDGSLEPTANKTDFIHYMKGIKGYAPTGQIIWRKKNDDFIAFLNAILKTDNLPWKKVCQIFVKTNNTPFNEGVLRNFWSKHTVFSDSLSMKIPQGKFKNKVNDYKTRIIKY